MVRSWAHLHQVNEKPFEDLKHCTAALTRGVVKFAQAWHRQLSRVSACGLCPARWSESSLAPNSTMPRVPIKVKLMSSCLAGRTGSSGKARGTCSHLVRCRVSHRQSWHSRRGPGPKCEPSMPSSLEECAENMSFRVDKAWRQRCSQRFRNVLAAS